MTELTWDAPGPGTWQFDAAHASSPTGRAVQELFPPAMAAGFQAFTAAYGLPMSHIDVRYVNGYPYGAVQLDLNLADRAVPPPVAAERAFEERRWRDELRWWTAEARPALVASHRKRQAVDLTALDDAELAGHLDAAADGFREGMIAHFTLIGATAIPVGDFLVHCRAWGLPMDDCLALLTGEHPLTVACQPVRAAIGHAKPRSLEEMRALSPDASRAVDELVDTVGCWIVGRYDVSGRTLGEEPAALVAAVLATSPERSSSDILRNKVSDDERSVFDDLLAEARFAFSARDDHAVIGGLWSIGIIRRGLLEGGRRLGLEPAELAFQLSTSELARGLRGGSDDLQQLAADRAADQAIAASATPPAELGEGGFGSGPPPGLVMPGALGRVLDAMGAYMEAMSSTAVIGIGDGVVRGRALVAFDPEDAIDRIEPGDILVTTTTTPAFGAVMPLLGGMVTTSGGALSHTAILARELGIPAVVGVADALVRIADGVTIEVDAAAGEVRMV